MSSTRSDACDTLRSFRVAQPGRVKIQSGPFLCVVDPIRSTFAALCTLASHFMHGSLGGSSVEFPSAERPAQKHPEHHLLVSRLSKYCPRRDGMHNINAISIDRTNRAGVVAIQRCSASISVVHATMLARDIGADLANSIAWP